MSQDSRAAPVWVTALEPRAAERREVEVVGERRARRRAAIAPRRARHAGRHVVIGQARLLAIRQRLVDHERDGLQRAHAEIEQREQVGVGRAAGPRRGGRRQQRDVGVDLRTDHRHRREPLGLVAAQELLGAGGEIGRGARDEVVVAARPGAVAGRVGGEPEEDLRTVARVGVG